MNNERIEKLISEIQNVISDEESIVEIRRILNGISKGEIDEKIRPRLLAETDTSLEHKRMLGELFQPQNKLLLEAIILDFARPAILVQNDSFVNNLPGSWNPILHRVKKNIDNAIPSVGHIGVVNIDKYFALGTGWFIHPRFIVTNRHVAEKFTWMSPLGPRMKYTFKFNRYQPQLDTKKEHGSNNQNNFEIERVAYFNPKGHLDVAILQVKRESHSSIQPKHLNLSAMNIQKSSMISVIGYPYYDSRNDRASQERVFQGLYGVKRIQPGYVTSGPGPIFTHDASTLGGNSGSPLIDLKTGEVCGLHFKGAYKSKNYAVSSTELLEIIARKRLF